MTVLATLQGIGSGEGFLIAPLGARVFTAPLSLQTDSGSADIALRASPDGAGLLFSQTSLTVTTVPTVIDVHATAKSLQRGDTAIEVLEGDTVVWRMSVTGIAKPTVHFRGRFEARFATQPAFYNANPKYTAISEEVGPGWTWALEGEPDFVPATGNVPERIETPVGREIRFNDPVALRSSAAPVVTVVDRVSGQTRTGIEAFTIGDPVIGQRVDLGPHTYFAGNREIAGDAEPQPEEFYTDANEPMGLFELHVGDRFSGASAVGPFTHKAMFQDEHTRTPDSRPIATGLESAAAELAELGLPNHRTFSETRIDVLLEDHAALPPGDSMERRNLKRRICHLLNAVSPAKRSAIMAAHPDFDRRAVSIPVGWTNKEVFNGKVDADLRFAPAGSSVIEYFALFTSFAFQSHMFAFHSDELCAHHISSVRAEPTAGPNSLDNPNIATRQLR